MTDPIDFTIEELTAMRRAMLRLKPVEASFTERFGEGDGIALALLAVIALIGEIYRDHTTHDEQESIEALLGLEARNES